MSEKRKIKARDIVNDIRAKMTDAELMTKYNLSAKGLQSVFLKLLDAKAISRSEFDFRPVAYQDTAVIKKIKKDDFISDIRAGLNDFQLMAKYDLSANGLQRAFKALIDDESITLEDLYNRPKTSDDTVFVECMRELPRHYLAIAVEIFELDNPSSKGQLRDITEKGVGITGIKAYTGEIKKFIIPAEKLIEAESIAFEARCVWSKIESDGECIAGFQILKISKQNLNNLRQLIRCVSFED